MAVDAVDPAPYLGRPHAESNCLALALDVLRDHGRAINYPHGVSPDHPVPTERWYSYWSPISEDALRALDVVVVHGHPLGVGVMISATEVLTTRPASGAFVCSLRAFRRAGIDGCWRLR